MCDNSFNSIDRILEFGMSMAIANQMILTMNACMANTVVPGADNAMRSPTRQYYMVIDNRTQVGPYEEKELAEYVKAGSLKPDTLVWRQGLAGWVFAKSLPEINRLFTTNQLTR